jgi:phenylpropionate dioxygenase-like ring-hydroxylating dioxygenase large terminal subunit
MQGSMNGVQWHRHAVTVHTAVQYAGHSSQVAAPGDYLTGEVLGCRYIVCRSQDGQLRAFHNVRGLLAAQNL